MENDFLINPHDKFFKESFSHKDTAESFIKEYLPESISKQIDFKTLEIVKDSFIDKELSEKYIGSPKLFDKLSEIFIMISNLSSDSRKTKFVESVLRYLTATVEKEKKEFLKNEILKVLKKGDSIMATIAEEWVREGKIEGKIEGKEEDAQKMIEYGMTDEVIHHVTGLPMNRIVEIRNNLKK
ncbi:MAG TPA: Rpn family recombination-promoting nuclease/putative transposase [Chitinispirillaceae bacterium]|nr:Rpn family recombination-promoting nuclease/putative transposase [Chitinispirillaceae bacterium]